MRETKTITLSACEVDIVTYITWGEKETIQEVIMSGANVNQSGLNGYDIGAVRSSKYKALEICIKEIRQDGKAMSFSREWMDNLSLEDGENLYSAVNEVSNSKKN